MDNVEVDGIKYDVSLLSPEGQSLFSVLLESNKRLKESQARLIEEQKAIAIHKAAAVTLIEELKGHLTDDSIIKAAE
tara:strand:+ start:7669 stop:7899 length:231 start_codon:yes stop_codon:yes gene_type:complete